MRHWMALVTLLVTAVGCKLPGTHNLPPSEMMMHPGPGVDGPGPGVMIPGGGGYAGPVGPPPVSQVAFVGPEGTQVNWDVTACGLFDSEPLIFPGRFNFPQTAIYRLKLTNIPGRPGLELYPTLEIAPAMPRTDAYLAHNAIPVQFTEEDLDQVTSGNFVTKVIYLPDAEYQELAIAGVETLVSTRLDPGVDPIVEADRRGTILAIVRLGNRDLQVPGGEFMAAEGGPVGPGVLPAGATLPVAGVNAPMYGMPISGTPIGLPGPPHVPLGVPAGLKKHVVNNYTHVHLPKPTEKVKLHVKQSPGFNYPKPASRAFIHESTVAPPALLYQPPGDKTEVIPKGH